VAQIPLVLLQADVLGEMTETLSIHDRFDVGATYAESLGEVGLCVDPTQRADFDRLFPRDTRCSPVDEGVFTVGEKLKVIDSYAVFLLTEMMERHPKRNLSVRSFVGDSVRPSPIGQASVSTGIYESLPNLAGGFVSAIFSKGCLRQTAMMVEDELHRNTLDVPPSPVVAFRWFSRLSATARALRNLIHEVISRVEVARGGWRTLNPLAPSYLVCAPNVRVCVINPFEGNRKEKGTP